MEKLNYFFWNYIVGLPFDDYHHQVSLSTIKPEDLKYMIKKSQENVKRLEFFSVLVTKDDSIVNASDRDLLRQANKTHSRKVIYGGFVVICSFFGAGLALVFHKNIQLILGSILFPSFFVYYAINKSTKAKNAIYSEVFTRYYNEINQEQFDKATNEFFRTNI